MERDFALEGTSAVEGERALGGSSAVPLAGIPHLAPDHFRQWIVRRSKAGARLSALFGVPLPGGASRLYGLLALDSAGGGKLLLASCDVTGRYPSLTPDCPQAHWFEREIREQTGVTPVGHPWLKPIRFEGGPGGRPRVGLTDFFQVEGQEVHEVAVGPIHAGIIEPGHFRFQCHGERVFSLEISLGYQHRGVEKALVGGPDRRTLHLMETLAGDTTVGHATAYARIIETLSGTEPPRRALHLRAAALELERLANHTGDLGALAGDVGYLPTMSFCGRLRGDFLNMSAMLCGNRFGRGLVRPGGAGFDADLERASGLLGRLEATFRDVKGAAELLFDTTSVLARFEHTGTVDEATARALGLVGPAGRASGLDLDVRRDYPDGLYHELRIEPAVETSGDVRARAMVRWREIRESARLVREALADLPDGPIRVPVGPLAPDSLAVSLVEGWRGEICHVCLTDPAGRIAHYKAVDPSFHNWQGLAMALRDQQISDFPLCNKSFNLSYCGHDL